MSFDTEPKDKKERILCFHSESDAYFEVDSRAEFESLCSRDYIDDVTDVPHHEAEFKRITAQKKKRDELRNIGLWG